MTYQFFLNRLSLENSNISSFINMSFEKEEVAFDFDFSNVNLDFSVMTTDLSFANINPQFNFKVIIV